MTVAATKRIVDLLSILVLYFVRSETIDIHRESGRTTPCG